MPGLVLVGRQEVVTCIVDVEMRGSAGEALCLAYKTTTHLAGGPVWLTDDGYVLRLRAEGATTYYALPPEAYDREVEGLPYPLPPYSPTALQYAWGFALPLLVVLGMLWTVALRVWRRRRQAVLDTQLASAPVEHGPPRLVTAGDHALDALVQPLLGDDEAVEHQAYALSWDYQGERAGDDAFFLVLTSRRLLLVRTRISGFGGIVYENDGVYSVPREDVCAAHVEGGEIFFVTRGDGVQRAYIVKRTKSLSNQAAFLLNVARILDPGGHVVAA